MLLIDIEMPERCGECPCFHAEHPMYCQLIKPPDKDKRIVAPYGLPRPGWCPLKEREASEPINSYGIFRCGNCRNIVGFNNDYGYGYQKNFCSKCGKAVKWG